MTETRKPKEPEVVNPRYAGATPAMVARALARGNNGEKLEKSKASAKTGDGKGFSNVYNSQKIGLHP